MAIDDGNHQRMYRLMFHTPGTSLRARAELLGFPKQIWRESRCTEMSS
jgi:hypothetical protein